MQPIRFPETNVTYAQDQPQYQPLPVHRVITDPQGRITCCWQLTFWERLKMLWSGVIWQQILTFNRPLQPQMLTVDKPEIKV